MASQEAEPRHLHLHGFKIMAEAMTLRQRIMKGGNLGGSDFQELNNINGLMPDDGGDGDRHKLVR